MADEKIPGVEEEGGKSAPDSELDSAFGEESWEEKKEVTPDSDLEGGKASGEEEDKGSHQESDTRTEEEKQAEADAAVAIAKAQYEALSPEEKVAADKTAADAETAALKAEYDKLTPEEKKAADDKKAEKEKVAATAEKEENARQHGETRTALEKSEKRRRDTEAWGQRLNQDMLQQKREILILQRQAKDPDYDPDQDESLKEIGPTEEEKAAFEQRKGRATASHKAAVEKYGEEAVKVGLAEYKATFGDDPRMQQQVMDADQPVEEALSVMKLNKFFGEYGQDPETIVSNIEKKVRTELIPKIREEESKRIMAELKNTSKVTKGLSGVKGGEVKSGKEKETGASGGDSMESIFG